MAQFFADPSGLTLPIVNEELFWGDAGIGLAIQGTGLAVAAIFGQGTPEQMGEWVPQCYGTVDEPKVGAFCASEPDAGSDVSAVRTTAKYDDAKDEWVLNGQKAWATNGGIADVHVVIASVDRELGSRGHAAFVIAPGHARLRAGREGEEARPARLAHGRRPPGRLPRSRARCLLGGKEKLDERLARVREGKKGKSQAAMQTFEATRPIVGAQAVGVARGRLRVRARLRQGARPVRPPDHREPGDRLHAREHEARDRRLAAARLARRVDGQDRARRSRTPRARCRSSRPARSPSG